MRGPGRTGVSTEIVPILEFSGHCASSGVPKRACGFGAGFLAVGDVGGEGEALGEGHVSGASSEGEGTEGLSNCGTVRRNSAPEGLVGGGRRRFDRLGGIEGELSAFGGGGPGGFGVDFAAVVGEDVEGGFERGLAPQVVGFWRNGSSGLLDETGPPGPPGSVPARTAEA